MQAKYISCLYKGQEIGSTKLALSVNGKTCNYWSKIQGFAKSVKDKLVALEGIGSPTADSIIKACKEKKDLLVPLAQSDPAVYRPVGRIPGFETVLR